MIVNTMNGPAHHSGCQPVASAETAAMMGSVMGSAPSIQR